MNLLKLICIYFCRKYKKKITWSDIQCCDKNKIPELIVPTLLLMVYMYLQCLYHHGYTEYLCGTMETWSIHTYTLSWICQVLLWYHGYTEYICIIMETMYSYVLIAVDMPSTCLLPWIHWVLVCYHGYTEYLCVTMDTKSTCTLPSK